MEKNGVEKNGVRLPFEKNARDATQIDLASPIAGLSHRPGAADRYLAFSTMAGPHPAAATESGWTPDTPDLALPSPVRSD